MNIRKSRPLRCGMSQGMDIYTHRRPFMLLDERGVAVYTQPLSDRVRQLYDSGGKV